MSITPEVQAKIQQWRQKAVAGTLTLDEMREAIVIIRQDRRTAATASTSSKKAKAHKEVKSADQMLNELEGL